MSESMNLETVEKPKRKADYIGKWLLLQEDVPPQWHALGKPMPPFRPKAPALVRISRRMNARETASTPCDVSHWAGRVLKVVYECRECLARHDYFIPESWIDEGRARFVEMPDEQA